ncbi:MAG: PQQ-dependent sugar dehydrogenase [Burkholderiaceae bacterium]|jgi:glucose/arabinose dehydrogenase|nr:PQQ-dependent sugar dehydrogenase [Burkholderiaceae bacterium]
MSTFFRCAAACAAAVAVTVMSSAAFAQAAGSPIPSRDYNLRLTTVTEGLEHPWGLAFLPDGRMLVTERPGRLRVIDKDGKLDPTAVAGLPRVDAQGQGGLLDVSLHPQFASNGWIYWSYAQRDEAGNNGTELARGKLAGTPGAYRMTDVQVLFRMAPKTNRGHHFGSRIVWDREGRLFLTLGDRGEMARAQRMDDHAGKILRLTDDGKPAPGNPFEKTANARPEIFSLGNRNVQGAALDPKTGALWAIEHGPQGGDELNLITAGSNYGWPVITYGANYVTGTRIGEGTEKAGMAQPVRHWSPSPAISGMAFYQGAPFAKWQGDALIGALRGQGVIRVRLNDNKFVEEEVLLRNHVGRVRDVRVGPDGFIYLVIDHPNGSVLRVAPAS